MVHPADGIQAAAASRDQLGETSSPGVLATAGLRADLGSQWESGPVGVNRNNQ